jgi:hypothetical protein
MAQFQISLVNPVTEEVAITYNCDTEIMTIVDKSNYDITTELGHARADFSNYRKVVVLLPDYSTYIFSSLGDGDETIGTPSGGDDTINYDMEQYGVHRITLISIPTYDAAVAYQASDDIVYYSGKIYKCIQNGTNKQPDTETAYWTEITDEDVTSKYLTLEFVYPPCTARTCQADLFAEGFSKVLELDSNKDLLTVNPQIRDAFLVGAAIYRIDTACCEGNEVSARNAASFIESKCNCEC